jgi:L,D-transpeptidase ErfK/SrfK
MRCRRSCLRLALGLCLAPAFPDAALAATHAPEGDLLSIDTLYEILPDDNLLDIARRFDLGYVEIVAANPGVDPWLPKLHTILHLPTAHLLPSVPRRGIVINLGAMRLYAFPPGRATLTFPIGTGVDIDMTPTGETRVVAKQVHPTWYPPKSIRRERPDLPAAIPPGPDDPLGDFILLLGWTGYGIHGTNKPDGVGRHVSHGCIRLYPEDIATLFPLIPVGTPVRVIDQRVMFGWSGDELYLQVYPTHAQADALEEGESVPTAPVPDLDRRVIEAAGQEWMRLNWDLIERAAAERRGIAVRITR